MLARGLGWFYCLAVLSALTLVLNQAGAQDDPPAATEAPAAADAAKPETTPAITEAAADPMKPEEKKEEPAPAPPLTIDDVNKKMTFITDTLWTIIAGMLVFFMNLGFGCVEAGFARSKNCVNILSKNFIVFSVTALFFWFIGWGLMFGNGSPYIGQEGLLMVSGEGPNPDKPGEVLKDNSPEIGDAYVGPYKAINWTGVPMWCKFFFQLVFAGTAATIVSGAVAERIKYLSFIVFTACMAVLLYPITGHWIWGGGWLAGMGFWDFAGSTVVHSVGGWSALTGALILGPRIGKYTADGKPKALPGHNMTAAFIGCLVLWLGWFGFNPGSTMSAADPNLISLIAVNTNFGAVGGTLAATAVAWIMLGKPDIGMTLNGCLAGLVAITAPCAWVTPTESIIIGLAGGAIVVPAVLMFDRLKVDDPVGATSVHLVNGVFGTLCVGLFAADPGSNALAPKAGLFHGGFEQLKIQVIGILAVGVYTLIISAICWFAIKFTIGLRVKPEEEIEGLDIGEHGNEAYHGFVMSSEAH